MLHVDCLEYIFHQKHLTREHGQLKHLIQQTVVGPYPKHNMKISYAVCTRAVVATKCCKPMIM